MKASLKNMKFYKGDNPYDVVGALDETKVKFSNDEDILNIHQNIYVNLV